VRGSVAIVTSVISSANTDNTTSTTTSNAIDVNKVVEAFLELRGLSKATLDSFAAMFTVAPIPMPMNSGGHAAAPYSITVSTTSLTSPSQPSAGSRVVALPGLLGLR